MKLFGGSFFGGGWAKFKNSKIRYDYAGNIRKYSLARK